MVELFSKIGPLSIARITDFAKKETSNCPVWYNHLTVHRYSGYRRRVRDTAVRSCPDVFATTLNEKRKPSHPPSPVCLRGWNHILLWPLHAINHRLRSKRAHPWVRGAPTDAPAGDYTSDGGHRGPLEWGTFSLEPLQNPGRPGGLDSRPGSRGESPRCSPVPPRIHDQPVAGRRAALFRPRQRCQGQR